MKTKKVYRENIETLKKITSEEKYGYFLKHYDKKDSLKTHIIQISVYDKLDNHGMNLLMRKIHKLKKNRKYSVKAYYKKPGRKELDYVYGNLEEWSFFSIAEINLKIDKWLSQIDISGTNLTNSEILIHYNFHLEKAINTYKLMHEFVSEHELHFAKYDFHFVFLRLKDLSYTNYLEQEEHCFYDYFQDMLCELFHSELGKKYPLPMEVCCQLKKFNYKKERKLTHAFLTSTYKRDNEYMQIQNNGDRFYAFNYFYGRRYMGTHLFRLFSEFSVEMYYRAFRSIEMAELELKMRKYLNSRKKSVSAKDIKWMINKLRGIEEKEGLLNQELKEETAPKWKKFDQNKWTDENIINGNTVSSYFKELYKRNLDFLQAISTTRDNKIIYIITIISLIVALVGLLISFWPIIKPEEKDVNNTNYYEYYYNDYRKTNEYKYSVF